MDTVYYNASIQYWVLDGCIIGNRPGLLKTLDKWFAKTSEFYLSAFALLPSCLVMHTDLFAV
jgi:hypothetical protein